MWSAWMQDMMGSENSSYSTSFISRSLILQFNSQLHIFAKVPECKKMEKIVGISSYKFYTFTPSDESTKIVDLGYR